MSQMTIYIDEDTVHRIEKAATREKTSVSKWVKERLTRSLDSEWPAGYFDRVIGSLTAEEMPIPTQPLLSKDSPREQL